MPLSFEEVQHLRTVLQGSFLQPALEQAVDAMQAQLRTLGLTAFGTPATVYDRMPDSLALRWGCPYQDPATGARVMVYISPTLMATGEYEGMAHVSVWFCLLPEDYSGRLMDYLGKGLGCVQVLAAAPAARPLTDRLAPETWSELARQALPQSFSLALAGIPALNQKAVDQLAQALTP